MRITYFWSEVFDVFDIVFDIETHRWRLHLPCSMLILDTVLPILSNQNTFWANGGGREDVSVL
jgi:hypothetical protein